MPVSRVCEIPEAETPVPPSASPLDPGSRFPFCWKLRPDSLPGSPPLCSGQLRASVWNVTLQRLKGGTGPKAGEGSGQAWISRGSTLVQDFPENRVCLLRQGQPVLHPR